MNKLSTADRVRVVQCLVEGNSIRATVRMTGIAKNTVTKLLVDLGHACAEFQDTALVNLACERVQCDEIWSFVGAKAKNVPVEKRGTGEAGDVWTWTAMDADSKLMFSWLVGDRGSQSAVMFMNDAAGRLKNRVQLTTDGHRAYVNAVYQAFGANVDYAMLIKQYGLDPEGERSYSPSVCTGIEKVTIIGDPDFDHISTSYVERQNLTMRMNMRRFTRLTNAFSKKVENHACAVALHFCYYNFVRKHATLKTTPAVKAGVADHIWTIEEMVRLLDSN